MTKTTLSRNTLSQVPQHISVPQPCVLGAKVGIVHIGAGNFHRAHQAPLYQDIMQNAGGDWRVVGVSLRSPKMADILTSQDGLYSIKETSISGNRTRIIGSIERVLFAPQQAAEYLEYMVSQNIKIITLTITEKGYCHTPSTGKLDLSHQDIIADQKNTALPTSALGWLAYGLKARMDAASEPVTIISCDNLPDNGRLLEGVLLEYCQEFYNAKLVNWIKSNVTFPNSMVDRIVPATTKTGLQSASQHLAMHDAGALVCEQFSQWVIKDNFANTHPDFSQVGVRLVADVAPYQELKLRMLNGTHSLLAYIGCMLDLETVADFVDDADMKTFLSTVMNNEIIPSVSCPAGFEIKPYGQDLIDRFCNSEIHHQTAQIAMDGSHKIPVRWVPVINYWLAQGIIPQGLLIGIAAWALCLGQVSESGKRFDFQDQIGDKLQQSWHSNAQNPKQQMLDLLSFKQIFSGQIARNDRFSSALIKVYNQMKTDGIRQLVKTYIKSAQQDKPEEYLT